MRSPARQSIFLHFRDVRLLSLSFQKLLAMPQVPSTSEHVSDNPEFWWQTMMTIWLSVLHKKHSRVCIAAWKFAKRRPTKFYGSFPRGFAPVTTSAYVSECKFSLLLYTPLYCDSVSIPGVLPMVMWPYCVDFSLFNFRYAVFSSP